MKYLKHLKHIDWPMLLVGITLFVTWLFIIDKFLTELVK